MRMVFTATPDQVYFPTRDRILAAFSQWARAEHRSVDPFIIQILLDDRWHSGDGLLGRWQPTDFERLLGDVFPRQVSLPADQSGVVVPTLQAFVDFLYAKDLADARSADRGLLHASLDKLAEGFPAAMADQARFGPAKYWTIRMLAAGVNPADEAEALRFATDLHAGAGPADLELLEQVMANQSQADDERHPPLPLVALADESTLRSMAGQSLVTNRLLKFVEWVGDGRALTAKGKLKLADAAELIALLDLPDVINPSIGDRVFKTVSSDELYELSVLFAWARAARIVRVVKGRLLPIKSAAKTLRDPLLLAERAFDAFFTLGEVICLGGYGESPVRWRFDDAAFGAVMALYGYPPRSVAELRDVVNEVAWSTSLVDEPDEERWRPAVDRDANRMLEHLAALGAVELADERAALTPLGLGLTARQLRDMGIGVRSFDDLLEETAEVVVSVAADAAAETADTLLTAWRDRHPETSRAELRALAARTDDPAHRSLAKRYAKTN